MAWMATGTGSDGGADCVNVASLTPYPSNERMKQINKRVLMTSEARFGFSERDAFGEDSGEKEKTSPLSTSEMSLRLSDSLLNTRGPIVHLSKCTNR